MPSKSNRFHSIDFVKGIAALSIVCLHCANNDAFDSIIHLVGRMAVPMFFIITGYYLPSMIKSGHITNHIVKILKIILGGFLFYLAMSSLDAYLKGNLWEHLTHLIEWNVLGRRLLFAHFPFNVDAGHLWYLMAILYVLCFILLFTRKYPVKKLYVLIPILFMGGYLISTFDSNGAMRSYYQNYLFTGIPYVLLGSYIREHGTGQQLSNHRFGLLIVIFAGLYLAEIGLYVFTGLPSRREHYLCIIPLVSLILMWAVKNPQFGRGNFITTIGREYSTYIYVIHFYFMNKMWIVFHGTSLDSKLQMLTSIAISLLVAYLYVQLKKYWKRKHQPAEG